MVPSEIPNVTDTVVLEGLGTRSSSPTRTSPRCTPLARDGSRPTNAMPGRWPRPVGLGAYRFTYRLSDAQRHARERLTVRDALVRTLTGYISVIRAAPTARLARADRQCRGLHAPRPHPGAAGLLGLVKIDPGWRQRENGVPCGASRGGRPHGGQLLGRRVALRGAIGARSCTASPTGATRTVAPSASRVPAVTGPPGDRDLREPAHCATDRPTMGLAPDQRAFTGARRTEAVSSNSAP